jgi:Ca2+-binding EF-hand superfamily protein
LELVEDGTHLKVDTGKIEVVVDRLHTFGKQQSVKAASMASTRSAKVMLESLLAKLRAMNKTNSAAGADSIFVTFDCNGDGGVNQIEFHEGVNKLGLNMSMSDVKLIWPVLDVDNSGAIEIDEFREMLEVSGSKGGNIKKYLQAKNDRNRYEHRSTRFNRQKRIMQKSEYAKQLDLLIKKVASAVRNKQAEAGLDIKGVFALFDDNSNAVFSRTEFANGLKEFCKCDLQDDDVEKVWSTFTITNGGIVVKEWGKFLNPNGYDHGSILRRLSLGSITLKPLSKQHFHLFKSLCLTCYQYLRQIM